MEESERGVLIIGGHGQNISMIMTQTTMSKIQNEKVMHTTNSEIQEAKNPIQIIKDCFAPEPIIYKNYGMETGNIYKAPYDVKAMSARAKRRREARNTRRRY